MLFGLPFLLAGLFITGIYFNGYIRWMDTQSWVETPCIIETAELRRNQSSDGTTYEAKATFRYSWEGVNYQGNRVSLSRGSDNIGSFQQDAYRELSRFQSSREPFRCFVNPENPAEAVLYRDLRWQSQAFFAIFALTFPCVGAGLVIGGFIWSLHQRKIKRRKKQHPEEPWLWKFPLADGMLRAKQPPVDLYAGLYTVWSAMVIAPLLWTSWSIGAFENNIGWLLAIFPTLWLVPAGITVYFLRRRLATGKVFFSPQSIPIAPGSTLSGHILLSKSLSPRLTPRITLTCERTTTSRSGKNTNTTSETLWKHSESLATSSMSRDIRGFRMPVEITIPIDAPTSDSSDDLDASADLDVRHRWRLTLNVPGTPVHAIFEIPVFHAEDSSQAPSSHTGARAPVMMVDSAVASLAEDLTGYRIQATFDANGIPQMIYSPPSRRRSLVIFLFFFNVIWTGIAYFLIKQRVPSSIPMIFPVVWTASAAAIWVSIVYSLTHARKVILGQSRIDIINIYGPIQKQKSFLKQNLSGFDSSSNMRSGSTSYYRVYAITNDRKRHVIADSIPQHATASALEHSLAQWLDT